MGIDKAKLLAQLENYGIHQPAEVFHNLSYEELFQHETNPDLEGYEKGYETSSGAVAVDTGIFTGRSPKDKYIVDEPEARPNVWWAGPDRKGSDNKPISEEVLKTCLSYLLRRNSLILNPIL